VIKHIILISIDSLRFDAIGCEDDVRYLRRYGVEQMRNTPVLDALAAEGVRFRQAVSAAPYTTASHASVFTGCYPPRHGVRAFLRDSLSPSVRTVAKTLRGVGYRTIAAIDFHELFRFTGLTRGFEQVIASDDQALLELMRTRRDQHLFVFVHFGDVHFPYNYSACPVQPGDNEDAYDEELRCAEALGFSPVVHDRHSRAELTDLAQLVRKSCEERGVADAVMFPRYMRGVARFDQGRFRAFLGRLRGLDLLDEALLIVMADHGEAPLPSAKRANRRPPMRFEHGEAVIEELIRVPLIVRCPGRVPSGRVVNAQVSLVDLMPTIFNYAGMRAWGPCDGVSLRDLLEGRAQEARAEAYSEVWYHDWNALDVHWWQNTSAGQALRNGDDFLFQACVRTPRYKYTETGSDLTDDEMILPEGEFARVAVRKLLGHVEDPTEMRAVLATLANGVGREALVRELRHMHFQRRALFDLSSDPFEQVNVLGRDIAARALGQEASPNDVARDLERRLDEIQGRPQPRIVAQALDHDAAAFIPPRFTVEYDAAMRANVDGVSVTGNEEARARGSLQVARDLAAAGDYRQMRACLRDAVGTYPWIIRHAWARMLLVSMGMILARSSRSPVAGIRGFLQEIRAALGRLDRHDRVWTKQFGSDLWAAVAPSLSLGWEFEPDHRAGGYAAAAAIVLDPAKLRRKVLVWLVARGVVGPFVADTLRGVVERVMRRAGARAA